MKDYAVTYSKAIAIILVVLGHAYYNTHLETWLNMFHVSIFFFMSGYCFKEKYLCDFKTFFKRKMKGLYWPFVKYATIFLLFHNVFVYFRIVDSDYFGLQEMASKVSYIVRLSYAENLLGGYWFLHSLFVSSFIFYLTVFLVKKSNCKDIYGFAALLCISSLLCVSGIGNILSLLREVTNASIIYFGYLYHKTAQPPSASQSNFKLGILCIALFISIISAIFFPGRNGQITIINLIPFVLTSIAMSIGILGLCQSCANSKHENIKRFLKMVGEDTLLVLTWHFLCFKLVSYLIIHVYVLNINQLSEFPVIVKYNSNWGWVYFIVSLLCTLALIILKKRVYGRYRSKDC